MSSVESPHGNSIEEKRIFSDAQPASGADAYVLRTSAPLTGALDVSGLKVVPSWLTVTVIRLDKLQVSVAPAREFCWRVGHRSR